MKVAVYLIIETTDFEGRDFKREIEELIADIDCDRQESSLLVFDMYLIGHEDPRNYYWDKEAE